MKKRKKARQCAELRRIYDFLIKLKLRAIGGDFPKTSLKRLKNGKKRAKSPVFLARKKGFEPLLRFPVLLP